MSVEPCIDELVIARIEFERALRGLNMAVGRVQDENRRLREENTRLICEKGETK